MGLRTCFTFSPSVCACPAVPSRERPFSSCSHLPAARFATPRHAVLLHGGKRMHQHIHRWEVCSRGSLGRPHLHLRLLPEHRPRPETHPREAVTPRPALAATDLPAPGTTCLAVLHARSQETPTPAPEAAAGGTRGSALPFPTAAAVHCSIAHPRPLPRVLTEWHLWGLPVLLGVPIQCCPSRLLGNWAPRPWYRG